VIVDVVRVNVVLEMQWLLVVIQRAIAPSIPLVPEQAELYANSEIFHNNNIQWALLNRG